MGLQSNKEVFLKILLLKLFGNAFLNEIQLERLKKILSKFFILRRNTKKMTGKPALIKHLSVEHMIQQRLKVLLKCF